MSQPSPTNVVAIIGLGGIGLAVARRLCPGHQLFIADFSEHLLTENAEVLRSEGHLVQAHRVDITSRNNVERFAGAAAEAGRIEAIVNTAGVSGYTETPQQILATNLLGAAHVIDAFLPVASPGSSLVALSSTAGHMITPPEALENHFTLAAIKDLLKHPSLATEDLEPHRAYGLAKRGNMVRAEVAARAWGAVGAKINTISPGIVSTNMGRAAFSEHGEFLETMLEMSGTRRKSTPSDI